MLAHGSNKGKKNCNKSDSRTAHTALLSKPHSCTHKAVIKKTTQPEENKTKKKKTKQKGFSTLRLYLPPFSRSLLHSTAKGIPWWPDISESSSARSYGKLMNWKMNRCRQRERGLDPSWRWNSRCSAVDTQVFQARSIIIIIVVVHFCFALILEACKETRHFYFEPEPWVCDSLTNRRGGWDVWTRSLFCWELFLWSITEKQATTTCPGIQPNTIQLHMKSRM